MRGHHSMGKLTDRIHQARLANGLTLLFTPMPFLKSISLGLSVLVGSRHEHRTEAGLCHLLEHMLFQGTATRDTREIARVITVLGGYLDAATSKENTAYYAQVPADDLALAMDVIADLVRNPRLGARELRKEQSVVLEEFRMVNDTPDDYIHDLFFSTLWPKHALGQPILGSKQQVSGYTRTSLLRFWRTHYHAANMVLAVAGNAQWSTLQRLCQNYFGSLPSAQPARPIPAVPSSRPRVLVKRRKHEQVHACIGAYGMAFQDKRKYAALAFSQLLGGGPYSRLFFEIRELAGLAYSIYSFVDFFQDTGVHGIYLACHPAKIELACDLVRREVRRLINGRITPGEVRDVKQQLRGNVILAQENPANNMWSMMHEHEYLGRHIPQSEILQEIENLNATVIQKAGKLFFPPHGQFGAILGPVSQAQARRLERSIRSI